MCGGPLFANPVTYIAKGMLYKEARTSSEAISLALSSVKLHMFG